MRRIIPLLLILTSCASPDFNDRASTENDIREAVFRYQFDIWKDHGAAAYYLDFSEKKRIDPPADFMHRFAGHFPPVKKVSQCMVRNLGEGVIDSETEEHGLIFRATSIKRMSDTEVEVSGGYYENGKSASGNTYTVQWRNGKWHVTKDCLHWIS